MFRKMRATLAAVLVASVVGTVVPVVGAQAAHADAAGKGGDYVPVPSSPIVLDTRNGVGATGERGEASTTTFTVTGGAVPTTGVGSVVLRITLLNPTEATWAVAWPDGQTRPGTTMISAGVGEDISNIAVVKVGPQGKVSVYNASGKTHMVAEVQGYFTSAQGTTGGGFVPVSHTRVVDTRNGTGTTTGTIPSGGSRTVTLTGGVIPAGAGAAMVNLLVPGAARAGWLAAGPGTSVNRTVLNFETGSTQSGAVLALPADGKVTVRNNGPDPINLVVTAEGYFGKAANQGAGLRSLTKRLINTRTAGNGQPVPANGTIDVQVGGVSGMATQAVAGAALNLVVTPAAAGYLKAWPAGEAEPSVSVMDFKANVWRANMIVLKPGTDGKVRVRNGSSQPAHVIVDLEGWFADPVPAVPVEQDSKMSMLMAAPVDGAPAGKLHHTYVDDGGDIRWGLQDNVDVEGAVQWTVLSDGQSFTGQPAISQLPSGQVRIFALRPNGAVWSRTQTAVGTMTWEPWVDLGGSMAASPEVAKLGTGVLFASDSAGKLWAYAQIGSVPFWRSLGDQDLVPGTVRTVEVQGGVRIFGVTATGSVKTIQYYDDGGLSGWTDLGGQGLNGKPAVVLRPGFVPQLFVRGADGMIQTKLQDQGGAWPTDWQAVDAGVAAGAPAAVKDPGSSRIAVVYRGTDNEIYRFFEISTGSNTWGGPELIAGTGNSDPASSDPTTMTFINSNGQTFMAGFISLNGVPHFYSRK